MQRRTFYNLEGEYKAEKLSLTKGEARDKKDGLRETVMDAWDVVDGKDPKERKVKQASQSWLKDQGHDINEALIQACKSGNAQALKLFFQLTEQLTEKQEITVGLTAEQHSRIDQEADKRIQQLNRGTDRS